MSVLQKPEPYPNRQKETKETKKKKEGKTDLEKRVTYGSSAVVAHRFWEPGAVSSTLTSRTKRMGSLIGKAPVLKTGDTERYCGFESCPIRHMAAIVQWKNTRLWPWLHEFDSR